MRVVIVCSYRDYAVHTKFAAAFVYEQAQSLERLGCQIRYLFIKGGGMSSYLRGTRDIITTINEWHPHIIHAHGGLCGFVSNLQRKVPVVTTYHGSDINYANTRRISKISIYLSAYNFFVSQQLIEKARPVKNYKLMPCGVDTDVFYPMDKLQARSLLGLDTEKQYVLFSKEFDDPIKNANLAIEAVNKLPNVELVELKGYTREQVNWLMNASDVALMTSLSEGSPQFIKEAMACNCHIVSTNVGDVRDMINGLNNCRLCSYDVIDVVAKLQQTMVMKEKNPVARAKILDGYSLKTIAERIMKVYEMVINEKC